MVAAATINVLLHRLLWRRSLIPDLRAREAGALGAGGGALLLASTALGILAASDPALGLAVARTVGSAAVFVSGAWGVALFGEIRGLLQVLFWACGLQLAGACAIIVMSQTIAC